MTAISSPDGCSPIDHARYGPSDNRYASQCELIVDQAD
jgi:hypothetical protein